jgi:hypothetical protein
VELETHPNELTAAGRLASTVKNVTPPRQPAPRLRVMAYTGLPPAQIRELQPEDVKGKTAMK